jgi:hypothetical protein
MQFDLGAVTTVIYGNAIGVNVLKGEF